MLTLREKESLHVPEYVDVCTSCGSDSFEFLGVQWMRDIYWQKHSASKTPDIFLHKIKNGNLQWGANMYNCHQCGTTIIDLP